MKNTANHETGRRLLLAFLGGIGLLLVGAAGPSTLEVGPFSIDLPTLAGELEPPRTLDPESGEERQAPETMNPLVLGDRVAQADDGPTAG